MEALDDNRDPRFGNKVYIENPNPHKDIFTIYWDNDVVNLTKTEAKALITHLEKFIS
jgi:hypothetical protein